MLLVSSEASGKSPRRAPGRVTSTFAVAPAARLGRSQDTSAANSRRPEPESDPDSSGVPFSTAGPASYRP